MTRKPTPGVSRRERASNEGLARLERQMRSGAGISDIVLGQWIHRYGEAARVIIRRHGRKLPDIEGVDSGQSAQQ